MSRHPRGRHRRRPGRARREPPALQRPMWTTSCSSAEASPSAGPPSPWESLRLLTPNWLSRLPGHRYTGPDPDGFMTAGAVAGYLRGYAAASARRSSRTPKSCRSAARGDGYRGDQRPPAPGRAAAVVIATGWCDLPAVPRHAAALDPRIAQLTPATLPQPGALPDGGVLVVGASATGASSPTSWPRAGREVVLAVGAHTRLPRRYRGRDVMWWLDAMGVFDRASTRRRPRRRASRPCSSSGSADGRDVDLRALQERGVRLAGRLTGVDGGRVRFADDLAAHHGGGRRPAARPAGPDRRVRRAPPAWPPSPARPVRACGHRRRGCRADRQPRGVSARSSGRPATGAPTRGCTCPSSTGRRDPARRRRHAGARDCTSSACGGSPGAARRSSTASGTTRPPSPAGADPADRLGARRQEGARVSAPGTSSWSARGSPAPRPRCCWRGPVCGCCASTGPGTAATPCRRTR